MSLLSRHATLPSNAQLSALLDGVDEVLLVLDARQRVSYCNPVAVKLLGCEAGQGVSAATSRLSATGRDDLLEAMKSGPAHCSLELSVDGGLPLPFQLSRGPASGWLLRAPAESPPPPLPRLAAGATAELVRLLWDSPQPLMVQDLQFSIVAANRALCEALGLPPDQLLGRDPIGLLGLDEQMEEHPLRDDLLACLQEGRQPGFQVERRVLDQFGRQRWYRYAPRWVSAEDGSPLMLAVLQDVTLERQARHEAERSGDELAQWFDLSPIGMLVYDATGLVVRSNAAFESLVGRSPVMLSDAPGDLCQLLAWEQDGPHHELRQQNGPLEITNTVTLADGRRQRLRARLRAFRSDDAALRVMAVVEDRSLEDEHDLAQLEIGALMDTAGLGVATYESSRGWVQSRTPRAGLAVLSGLPDGLPAISVDQVDEASRDEFERLQQALREGRRAQVRYAVNMPEKGQRWLLTRVEPGKLTGGRAAVSVVTLDITEQEASHRRSDQLLREVSTILDGTTAGIGYLRGERLVRCNASFEAMLGLDRGAATGANLDELLAGQEAAQALLRHALAQAGRHEIEINRILASGRTQWLALSASRGPGEAAPDLVVVLTDISHLKAQQAELQALARERALMFSLSDVGITYMRHGRIERANDAMASLTGYSAAELQQLPLAALFEDADVFAGQMAEQHEAVRALGLWRGERRLRRRDGRLLWVQVSKRGVDESDLDAGMICSYVDVDERQHARAAVHLQAERTRAILDSVLVGIVTVGDGGIEWMNRSARRMFGGELADFVGEPIAIVATDDAEHPLRATHYRQALADGQAETFECRLRARDGREFWVVGNAVVTGREPVRGGGSQITFALLDIERRRQAEVSIAQTQAGLQRIIETAPLAIALFDAGNGRVLRLNQMAAQFFGRSEEAVLGLPPDCWYNADEASALLADMQAALQQPDGVRREVPRPMWPPTEGALPRVWDMRLVSLDASAAQPQVLLVASDVTEQRVAEKARFDAAVSQREMLVKEVHHRIKNNLQGVAG